MIYAKKIKVNLVKLTIGEVNVWDKERLMTTSFCSFYVKEKVKNR
jgi:hypothetical protein